jgi:hypothetical protein
MRRIYNANAAPAIKNEFDNIMISGHRFLLEWHRFAAEINRLGVVLACFNELV